MFTGIVEEIGIIQSVRKGEQAGSLTIKGKRVLEKVKLGDSIAVNGVCLTVTGFSTDHFEVDVMAETMRKTNLNQLQPNKPVNLERALQLGDRLGGHIVSGHIDGMGIIKNLKKEENAVWVTISAPEDILKYVIPKGSIAIDGISLTVAYVDESEFRVSVIPHTKEVTTLLTIGEKVNLECDMIGKYVERLLNHGKTSKEGIDLAFLDKHGFL